MKQGTVSVLFGCHSPIHSILVVISYWKLFGRPKFWQLICIFLHDVGHIGKDYLDNYEEKKLHWIHGAYYAFRLFGLDAWRFTAGHCAYSYVKKSNLYFADKYSWYIAPKLWLLTNIIFEPKIASNKSKWQDVLDFKEQVRNSIESGEYTGTHSFYLERIKNDKN